MAWRTCCWRLPQVKLHNNCFDIKITNCFLFNYHDGLSLSVSVCIAKSVFGFCSDRSLNNAVNVDCFSQTTLWIWFETDADTGSNCSLQNIWEHSAEDNDGPSWGSCTELSEEQSISEGHHALAVTDHTCAYESQWWVVQNVQGMLNVLGNFTKTLTCSV